MRLVAPCANQDLPHIHNSGPHIVAEVCQSLGTQEAKNRPKILRPIIILERLDCTRYAEALTKAKREGRKEGGEGRGGETQGKETPGTVEEGGGKGVHGRDTAKTKKQIQPHSIAAQYFTISFSVGFKGRKKT